MRRPGRRRPVGALLRRIATEGEAFGNRQETGRFGRSLRRKPSSALRPTRMSETRTYRGGSLEELLPRIRAELGDDAVVVRQREGLTGGVAGFFQKRTVEIEARRGQSSLGVEWFAGDPEEH